MSDYADHVVPQLERALKKLQEETRTINERLDEMTKNMKKLADELELRLRSNEEVR